MSKMKAERNEEAAASYRQRIGVSMWPANIQWRLGENRNGSSGAGQLRK
jgi:hypothetical protein